MTIVKKLKKCEIEVMAIASKSGAVTYEFVNKLFCISIRRLNNLYYSGYLEKYTVYQKVSKGFKIIYIYTLGSKGKEFVIENNISIAVQGFNGYRHLRKMQEIIYNLVYKEGIPIENILNENEQKIFFSKEINDAKLRNIDYRINDLAVIMDRYIKSIEVDSGYSEKIKQQHKTYAEQVLNVKYEIL